MRIVRRVFLLLLLAWSGSATAQGSSRPRDIVLRGAAVRAGQATVLAAKDVHACNTFDAPNTVQPAAAVFSTKGRAWTQRFPAASVTKLAIELE